MSKNDFDKISQWAAKWLVVTFNPPKTESLLISRKTKKDRHPQIFMQNHKVVEFEPHKHLDSVLSSDCSWHQHIKSITDKAWKRINIIRKFKFKLDRKSLETIYIAFIRRLLEYGDIIWDNCTQYEKKKKKKKKKRT